MDEHVAQQAMHGTTDYMIVDDGKKRAQVLAAIDRLAAQPEPEMQCPYCETAPTMKECLHCKVCGGVVVTPGQYRRNSPKPEVPADRAALADATDDGWKLVSVVGFDSLMESLERAHRKGYMPDAIVEEYEGFDYRAAPAPAAGTVAPPKNLPAFPWKARNIGGICEVLDADGNVVIGWVGLDDGRKTFKKRQAITRFIAEATVGASAPSQASEPGAFTWEAVNGKQHDTGRVNHKGGYFACTASPTDARRIAESLNALAAAPEAPGTQDGVGEGFKLLKDTTHAERSWAEDAGHENGNYSNSCVVCLRQFVGHKRRCVCKVCAAAPQAPTDAHKWSGDPSTQDQSSTESDGEAERLWERVDAVLRDTHTSERYRLERIRQVCDHALAAAPKAVAVPLTVSQVAAVSRAAQIAFCLNKHPSFEQALVAGVERACAAQWGVTLKENT
jgi:hypothetical protein